MLCYFWYFPGGSYVIRLEHIYDRGDTDDILSEPVDVNLKGFIESLGLKGTLEWIKEASLGGNVRELLIFLFQTISVLRFECRKFELGNF